MQHRINPIRHRADQTDHGFRIVGLQPLAAGDSPQWVVAAPLPQLDAVGELLLHAELLTGPDHGLSAIQVQGLGSQQQQVELFNAPAAEVRSTRGRGLGHGCDDARG